MTATGIDWYRSGEKIASMYASGDAVNCGGQIREWLDFHRVKIRAATDVLACFGEADFGQTELYLPSCGYIAGDGSGSVTWTTRCMIDGDQKTKPSATPGFVLDEYASFQYFHFVGDCWNKQEDGGLIGWRDVLEKETIRADYKIPPIGQVTFADCILDARGADWGIYAWNPTAKKRQITIKGGVFYVSRIGVAACSSGSSSAPIQDVLIDGTQFDCDANRSRSYGETSGIDPAMGGVLSPVVIREGRCVMRNVVAESVGLLQEYDPRPEASRKWGCSRIAGLVTDKYTTDGQPCEITIDGCTSAITPNLSKVANDIDCRHPKSTVKILRHEGSGADGSFSKFTK